MKTIKCSFVSEGKNINLTAILTDDLTELSKSKQNQATDLINDFIQEDNTWGIYFDREEQEKIELGYELVFKAEDGKPILKPVKAITWVGGIITDVQKLKVNIKG